MNLYGDLNQLKALLSITTTAGDAILMDMLERASRTIDQYTGQLGKGFYVTQAVRYFDGSRGRQDIDLLLSLARLDIDPILTITEVATDPGGTGVYSEIQLEGVGKDYMAYPLNIYPKLWLAAMITTRFGMFARGIPAGVRITGAWGYGDGLSANPVVVSASIVKTGWNSTDVTNLDTDAATGMALSPGQTILVESEQMYITAITGTKLTVIRGVNGTTAATHAAAKVISIYRYVDAVMMACYMQAARWWRRRDTAFATTLGSPLMGSWQVHQGLDPDVQTLLAPYVMIKVG